MSSMPCDIILGYLIKRRKTIREKLKSTYYVSTNDPSYVRLITEELVLSDLIEEVMRYMSKKESNNE